MENNMENNMQKVDAFDYAKEINKALKDGILITTKVDDKVNTMVIAWGTLGVQWNKPIFITFVREGRYTSELLEKNGEFTVNIPLENVDKKIIGFAGSKSGRNVDKIKELNLTLVDGQNVSVPAIKEFPLTLECKVVYKQLQDRTAISEENLERHYPQDVGSDFHASNKDFHIAYYGEIVNAYILK